MRTARASVATTRSHLLGGGVPQMNKFEQVSGIDHQMLLGGGGSRVNKFEQSPVLVTRCQQQGVGVPGLTFRGDTGGSRSDVGVGEGAMTRGPCTVMSKTSWVMITGGPPNRITDTCENITFPQLRWQPLITFCTMRRQHFTTFPQKYKQHTILKTTTIDAIYFQI